MPRISVKCPQCNLGMTGTDPERFRKPITCPKCNHVFQVAVAQSAPARMTPPPLPPSHAPKRSSLRLFAVAGLALALVVSVGAFFAIPLLKDRGGRRGSGTGTGETGGDGGKRYALLIGVNEYDNLGHLRYAENDAVELADVLGAAGYEVTLLTTSEGKRDPTRAPNQANVKDHLARIARPCKKADTLVLAFAGHGMQFDDQAYFCPSDADERRPESMVSLTRVYAEMGDSKAGARLLLVDACRNDGRRSGRRGVTGTGAPPSGVAVLFSCKQGEFANETADLKHGIFFHFVLQGLKGEALNRDGEVTWDGLNEYVKKQVSRNVGKMAGGGAKQTPHAMANLEGESPVLVSDPARRQRPAENPPRRESPSPLDEQGKNSIGMEFKLIPKGKFTMGASKEDDENAGADEKPHEVKIEQAFYLGKYEVTQDEWVALMKYNPSYFCRKGKYGGEVSSYAVDPSGGKDKLEDVKDADLQRFPVENVSSEEAQKFIDELNAKEKKTFGAWKYSLPTEAQWEYACRGGAMKYQKYHFGDTISKDDANFDGKLGRTEVVGKYPANKFGLHDMHGNVHEWCLDWYDQDYKGAYKNFKGSVPVIRGIRVGRVIRGGSWGDTARYCRSAFRGRSDPGGRGEYVGFRAALVPTK